jgi:hypothetical protein
MENLISDLTDVNRRRFLQTAVAGATGWRRQVSD